MLCVRQRTGILAFLILANDQEQDSKLRLRCSSVQCVQWSYFGEQLWEIMKWLMNVPYISKAPGTCCSLPSSHYYRILPLRYHTFPVYSPSSIFYFYLTGPDYLLCHGKDEAFIWSFQQTCRSTYFVQETVLFSRAGENVLKTNLWKVR